MVMKLLKNKKKERKALAGESSTKRKSVKLFSLTMELLSMCLKVYLAIYC